MYPKEVKSICRREIFTLMLIAALFTIGKKEKQPKCSSSDEQMKNMWYVHTTVYYSTTE
jgi:hypothetical protein